MKARSVKLLTSRKGSVQPLTIASIARRLWISQKFTNKRIVVINTSPLFSAPRALLPESCHEMSGDLKAGAVLLFPPPSPYSTTLGHYIMPSHGLILYSAVPSPLPSRAFK